jgi:drug/metabolite transporter (DMT)-like permease
MSGIVAMCGAVALFSLTGALVAVLPASGLASMALVSFGSGVALIGWTFAAKSGRSQVPLRPLVWLTVLNLAQGGLYYVSLKLAPTGPAAALHLAAPVILLLWALVQGRRRLGVSEIGTLCLLVAGLSLAATSVSSDHAGRTDVETLAGLTLALLSAVAMAAMLTMVFSSAQRMSLQFCNGIKSLAGAALLAPALLTAAPSLNVSVGLIAVGAFVCAPGLALCWFALSRVPPTTTSTLDLFEAVLTPAITGAAFGMHFTGREWLIMVPIVAAALLEVWRPRPVSLTKPGRRQLAAARMPAA